MWWMAIAVQVAAQAPAGTVYLTCRLGDLTANFSLNEASGRATLALSAGHTAVAQAYFKASEVSIPDEPDRWVIDRQNLTIRRIVTIGASVSEDAGTCTLDKLPVGRAF